MNSSARLDDLAQRFQEDPRRYFAPLANEYRKGGQPDRAVELCRAQLAQHEGHLSGHVVLALALHDLGERNEARRAYQEALQLDPENVLVLRSLGDLARESGEPETARDWYERAMGVDPRDPEVARRLAALEREQEQQSISVSDLSFTAALAAAELRHRDEDQPGEDQPGEDQPGEIQPDEIQPGEIQPRETATVEPVEAERDGVPSEPDMMDEAAEFTAGFFATALDQPVADQRVDDESIIDQLVVDQSSDLDLPSDLDQPVAEQSIADDAVIEAPALGELTPVAHDAEGRESVEPDMDRLFAELEPLTDDLLGGERGRQDDLTAPPESEEPLGTDLAVTDGPVVVPDLPPMPEFEELPTLEVFHDVEDLEEVPAEASAREVTAPEASAADVSDAAIEVEAAAPAPEDLGADEPAPDHGVAPEPEAAPEEAHPSTSSEEGPTPLVADEWTMSLDSIGFEPEPAEYSATSSAPDPGVAFVTETMAQLYLQQGLTQQALGVYRQLAEERPHEEHLRDRVAELEARLEAERAEGVGQTAAASHGGVEDEPPAASWLQRMVRARPTVLGLPTVAEPQAPAVEPEGAEELSVPPSAEVDEHDAPAFEWAIPNAEPEAQADTATEEIVAFDRREPALVEPEEVSAEQVPAEADDDPWFFEGERMAAAGFSGAWKSVDDVGSGAAGHAAGATGDETGAGAETKSGAAAETRTPLTLDELFERPVPVVEEQAAGALAAATVSMQDDPEVDAQLGEAVAEDPSSLLHVLRGTPRSVASLRQGASFSFDQFFRVDEQASPTGSGASGAAPGTERQEPAPPLEGGSGDGGTESRDDLADFHAWLSGLSKS